MNLKITKTLSVCLLALLASADLVKAQSAWTIANGGGSATAENSRSICTDAAGNIYITGSFQNTVDFNFGGAINSLTATGSLSDIFIASYEPDGDYRWAVRAGSSDADNTGNGAICADGTNVYVTGNFSGSVLFGATGLTSAGGTDVFVAKLNATTGAWT